MREKTKTEYYGDGEIRGERGVFEPREMLEYWYAAFRENFYNGRRITLTDNTTPFSGEKMYTCARGYSELMSYVMLYLLENSLGEISLTLSRKDSEIRLCVLSKTRREGVLDPIASLDEYVCATGEEDRRIANAFRCAYRAYAELCYSRNAFGDEYFDIIFNRADVGTLGFKARDTVAELREGIAFARSRLNLARFPHEPSVNP